jgi:D-lactate dehydrogenase
MKVAVFSSKAFEKDLLEQENALHHHELVFFEAALNEKTAELTAGFDAVSCFITDTLNALTLAILHKNHVRLVALRSAGFNHVDVDAAHQLGLTVVRVPNYSPYAVAEFAVGLILILNRKIHRAYQSVREHNFLLTHLMGFDLHGKTVGIIGTGKIGTVFARIMNGFGCKLLAHDRIENSECLALGVRYVSLNELYAEADMISLHCPLTEDTRHILNRKSIAKMKPGVMVINTGRGALIDTKAMIKGLKTGVIGYLGLDVYEEEEKLFFRDLSEAIIQDDIFLRLQTFPNVVITSHQAFFTKEAVANIMKTTMSNISLFEKGSDKIEANTI